MQDALYDAEEYLRSELAENPGKSEADVIAAVAGSYGAPDEVADIYRDTEVQVQTALRAPPPPPRKSALGQFFGVIAEPRTYGALFYMLLSLATGIFYFTWVVTGISLSAGLAVLIIGIPFVILFFGSVRVLSLVEGRIVEVMLGERMPRRPLYTQRAASRWLERIKELFTDPRTWAHAAVLPADAAAGHRSTSRVAVTGLSVSLSLIAAPVALLFGAGHAACAIDDWILIVDGAAVAVAAALCRGRRGAAVRDAAPGARHRPPARPAGQAHAGEDGAVQLRRSRSHVTGAHLPGRLDEVPR